MGEYWFIFFSSFVRSVRQLVFVNRKKNWRALPLYTKRWQQKRAGSWQRLKRPQWNVEKMPDSLHAVVLSPRAPCATCELNYWCISAHMAVWKTTRNLPPGGAYLTDGACLSSKFHHAALRDAGAARLAAPDMPVGHRLRHSFPGSPGQSLGEHRKHWGRLDQGQKPKKADALQSYNTEFI